MDPDKIQVRVNSDHTGEFFIEDNNTKLAEMVFSIKNETMTVHHTEVSDDLKGKGVAAMLLDKMEKYARENHLRIHALCPYVAIQFRRQEARFSDLKI